MYTPRVSARQFSNPLRLKFFAFSFFIVSLFALHGATAFAATTLNVPAGGNLQAALDAAQPGDTVVLAAGATYTGSFQLPNKGASNEYITVRSSRAAELAEGARVSPAQSGLMARLVSPNGQAALKTETGAHHYRFVGLEVMAGDGVYAFELISFGDGSEQQNQLDQVPHHLIVDRCYVHGDARTGSKRGIGLNSAETSVVNSYVSDFKSNFQDTQAVCGWNGPGPFHIVNNYLEASGENVMFGGADASIPGLIPSDIEVRGNHFVKPLAWKRDDPSWDGSAWGTKNLFELKCAQRVRVEGNIFENCWKDWQGGTAIVLTVRNQGGGNPWAILRDIEFTNNVVRNVEGAINILGQDDINSSQKSSVFKITNNLVEKLRGRYMLAVEVDDLVVEHNTIVSAPWQLMFLDGKPMRGFVFRNNVAHHDRSSGIYGRGVGTGTRALVPYFTDYAVTHNVFYGAKDNGDTYLADYPAGNFFPVSSEAVSFNDTARDDYRLQQGSPYKNAGTDGKDIGCDFAALSAALNGAGRVTIPSTPAPVTLQHVAAAYMSAATLAASTGVLSSAQLDSLIAEIMQANATAQSEVSRLGESAGEVEVRLTVALYFTRAAQSLTRVGATTSSVRSRLQIAAEHLNRVREALTPSVSNVALSGVEASTKAVPSIGRADARSSATSAAFVAPASAATVVLDRAVTTFGTRTVPATARTPIYELAGISVTVGGRAATLVDVASSRVGFVVPRGVAAGEAEVVVTAQSGAIGRGRVIVADVAPGIFVKSIGGVGVPLGKAGFSRGGFFRTTTMDTSVTVATKLGISATGFSFAAPNTNLANDLRTATGTTPNLAESVAVEARARDGRTWWLNVEFAGVSHAGTGVDRVTAILPPELRNVGTLELTLVIGAMRSNAAQLNFRQPLPQEEDEPEAVKLMVRRK